MTILLKFLIFLLFGAVRSKPADEVNDLIKEAELALNSDAPDFVMKIIPSGYPPHMMGREKKIIITDLLDEESDEFEAFMEYVDKGCASKGLTFNIYDDEMRGAAVALFRLFQNTDEKTVVKVYEWAKQNINDDMLEYAWRLATLYGVKFNHKELDPPFIAKPNYFVNSETIKKAMMLKITNGRFDPNVGKVNQFYKSGDIIFINTNYSNWDSFDYPCDGELNYFREDVGLNSYYYGIHLLHPFWMSNVELNEIHERHAEHYYFSHQQLMARYLLEKEHQGTENDKITNLCENFYNPYLTYDNGLPFPTRTDNKWEWTDGRSYLTAMDIAMKECISRKLIIMDNGTKINMTEENHTDLLAKLIRANLDGVKAAKIVRSLYGYSGNVPSTDTYNPSPSVLHHPETSLRDPIFWELINKLLTYFIEYKNSMLPFDMHKYEDTEITILDAHIPNLTTYFTYYEFDIGNSLSNEIFQYSQSPFAFAARQRRLTHIPFHFDFTINASEEMDVIVRLFLGPQCNFDNCWEKYAQFFELDSFKYHLMNETQTLSWSSKYSNRLSDDYSYNYENAIKDDGRYSMFKFPKTLIIPRGLEYGLNLTLFVMITSIDDLSPDDFMDQKNNFYKSISYELDNKPLGFPFHRTAHGYNAQANNYKFYNITIYHKKTQPDKSGIFTANVY